MAKQTQNKKGGNNNRRGGKGKKDFAKKEVRVEVTSITYSLPITVAELADKLNRNASEIIKLLFMMGTMVTINSSLDEETVELICMEFNVECKKEIIIDEIDF